MSPYQNKDNDKKNYWIKQNVRYYWEQEQVNHSRPNHIINGANLNICYQSLLLKLK